MFFIFFEVFSSVSIIYDIVGTPSIFILPYLLVVPSVATFAVFADLAVFVISVISVVTGIFGITDVPMAAVLDYLAHVTDVVEVLLGAVRVERWVRFP